MRSATQRLTPHSFSIHAYIKSRDPFVPITGSLACCVLMLCKVRDCIGKVGIQLGLPGTNPGLPRTVGRTELGKLSRIYTWLKCAFMDVGDILE